MTAAAIRLQSTPIGPYIGLMKNMDVRDMQALVDYMNEVIRETEEAKRIADDDFLAKKMAEITISPRISKLISDTRITPEEASDERTRYILGLDR